MVKANERDLVYLAALLHDIGKIYAEDEMITHSEYTNQFLEELEKTINFTGLNSVKTIISNFLRGNRDDNGDSLLLANIIEKAHSSLTGKEKPENEYSYTPLESILARVDLGIEHTGEKRYYRPGAFDIEHTLPVDKQRAEEDGLSDLREKMIKETREVEFDDVNSFLIFINALLKKYLWSIPAGDESEESLYDHLKLTAAFSLILYDMQESEIEDKYLLIGGDLSGIQDYIYDIANIGKKKVARRLRARSFFISALSDVILHKIMHKLDLRTGNIIISTGGKFYLLAANNEKTCSFLSEFKKELNEWLFDEFQAQIYFNLSWQAFSGDKFHSFSNVYDSLNDKLRRNKLNKFNEVLKEGDDFLFDREYDKNAIPCESCHKLWQSEKSELCIKCLSDEKTGNFLVKSSLIAFSREKPEHDRYLSFFQNEKYYLTFISEGELPEKDKYYLVYNIKDSKLVPGYPSDFKFYANYVPRFSGNKKEEVLCVNCSEDDCYIKDEFEMREYPYSFSCLAQAAVDDHLTAEKAPGLKSLGVLKADVDHLGAIFSIGTGNEETDIFSIISLSRMINYFFAGLLPELFSKRKTDEYLGLEYDPSLNYVVYAGGDDLLIVGPWDNIILTAGYIRDLFNYYCTDNPNITISAGVSIVKPNFPIARSSELAGDLEKRAKEDGRNSLVVFNEKIKWSKFAGFTKMAQKLDYYVREGVLSSAFVHRLFRYYNMNKHFLQEKDPEYLKWVAYFRYDVARNLSVGEDKKSEETKLNKEARRFLQRVVLNEDDGNYRIKDLNFALHWAYLRNR